MNNTFNAKYEEFCVDLLGACPELKGNIEKAKSLTNTQRFEIYKAKIFKNHELTHNVLPGVTISESIWNSFSEKTVQAIREYNSILDLCVIYLTGETEGVSQEWIEKMMKEWKDKMEKVDFNSMSEKFFNMFGAKGDKMPPLPEKFLKGQMAKLAEELVKEFDPKEFGFSEADMEECEKNPAKAFEILIRASSTNPNMIQNALQKIGKRLQQKIQTGQLRPQELAREAEELMKEFQNNPAFVEILESFKDALLMHD